MNKRIKDFFDTTDYILVKLVTLALLLLGAYALVHHATRLIP